MLRLSLQTVICLQLAHLIVKRALLEGMESPSAMPDSVIQDTQRPLMEHASVSDYHFISYVPTILQCGLVYMFPVCGPFYLIQSGVMSPINLTGHIG